ncbi:hypothetical protein [Streptomyces sp. NPDC057854]|uniref:hypothetical protein n=1 Tax=unclassified Streptomyces TaxID=2593676 RepID=UPI0036ACD298
MFHPEEWFAYDALSDVYYARYRNGTTGRVITREFARESWAHYFVATIYGDSRHELLSPDELTYTEIMREAM